MRTLESASELGFPDANEATLAIAVPTTKEPRAMRLPERECEPVHEACSLACLQFNARLEERTNIEDGSHLRVSWVPIGFSDPGGARSGKSR
jgi:hypothetical protein